MKTAFEKVKKYYGYILLFIILLVVILISFKPGLYLLSNDNYSPELNPTLTILRSILSPAWRSYRVFGFASESEQADIFRTILFWIGGGILPTAVLGQLYYLFSFTIGSWFTGLLSKNFVKGSKLGKYSQLIFLISGVMYFTTLWTVWVFYQSMGPYITNFGFLPVLLYVIYRYIKNPNGVNGFYVFLGSLFFTATCVIATLFVSDFIFILAFVLGMVFFYEKEWKDRLILVIKTLGIFLSTQLFWILPFVFYTLFVSGDIINSYTNRTITSSVIDLETQMQSALNTARLYSRILTDSDGKEYLFSWSEDFQAYDFYKIVGLVPALLSLVGTIYAIVKKNWKFLIFILMAFGTWFIMKVTNPPFGEVFTFMQDHIPLFKQVFRWPSSKLSEIYLICVSILSGFGFMSLILYIGFFLKKTVKNILIAVATFTLLSLQFIYASYIFNQELFSDNSLVELPNQYYALEEYLSENGTEGRIYYAPPANNNYFREYDWGFRGSQFISYIIQNPMMDMSSAVGSTCGEDAMLNLYDSFKAGDHDSFLNLLQQYDVKYILVDRSLVADGFSYDINWNLSEHLWNDYNVIWKDDFLELYMVPQNSTENLTEVTLSNQEAEGYFTRQNAEDTSLNPFTLDLQDYTLQNSWIVGQYTHNGKDVVLSSNISDINADELPTGIHLEGNQIKLSPVYPYIVGMTSNYDVSKTFKTGVYDYYSINNQVFTKEDLENGINIGERYSEVTNLYGLKDSDFYDLNITDTVASAQGVDCSGSSTYETSILSQGNASGLILSSEGNLPCVYGEIELPTRGLFGAKVELNWEAKTGNYPGYCLYSESEDRCLNDEKFIYTEDPFGEVEILIPEVIDSSEKYSLILYAINQDASADVEMTFRNVVLKYVPVKNKLTKVSEVNNPQNETVVLENSKTYDIAIPLLYSGTSYIYNSNARENIIWQPSITRSSDSLYKALWNNGMELDVQNEFINFSNNLFSTNPHKEYLVYWEGENISNIPANICLIYDGDEECWYQEMLLEGQSSYLFDTFESNSEYTNRLDVVYNSVSYSNATSNILSDFVVMEVPEEWYKITYSGYFSFSYSELEAQPLYNPLAVVYGVSSNDVKDSDTILTIPQASDYGWLAISVKDSNISLISNDNKVSVNGWKQGWDINSLEFDNIYIIYWPNLLGYIGYFVILTALIVLIVNLVKERKIWKKIKY